MAILLATLLADWAITTVLVGLSVGCLASRFKWPLRRFHTMIALMVVFAALDLYYVPALYAIDATVTVNNAAVAEFLGLQPRTQLSRILGPDPSDAIVWATEAFVAAWIAVRFAGGAREVAREHLS